MGPYSDPLVAAGSLIGGSAELRVGTRMASGFVGFGSKKTEVCGLCSQLTASG